jgi:thioredoxin reductase
VKIGSHWYKSEAVILANGAAARWLGLPNEEKFRNKGISACATCDGPLPIFRNKELYVIVSIKTDVKCFILTKESTVFSFHDQGRR